MNISLDNPTNLFSLNRLEISPIRQSHQSTLPKMAYPIPNEQDDPVVSCNADQGNHNLTVWRRGHVNFAWISTWCTLPEVEEHNTVCQWWVSFSSFVIMPPPMARTPLTPILGAHPF
jgi:hypothetical protein